MNCSAPESGVSKRLSWGRVMQKLVELNHVDDTKPIAISHERQSGYLPVISTEDPFEEALCAETVDNLSEILGDASATTLGWSRLLVPHQLLEHIGQELLHLAAGEPCGLRGALIDLCVENGKSYQSIGQLAVDPSTVPTFHLTFLLRPDLGGLWPKFTMKLSNSVRLSSGFTVAKKKLYSSSEVYIEEL
ncbi:DNA damage-inducible transcript 4 protein-like [Salminus brasiliensis]|uniref:DNA damage-inducible transcript 4 protein-like n=1 Tax=Salminus brasiliensis TaxID=930266 RepID=UPI003B836BDC